MLFENTDFLRGGECGELLYVLFHRLFTGRQCACFHAFYYIRWQSRNLNLILCALLPVTICNLTRILRFLQRLPKGALGDAGTIPLFRKSEIYDCLRMCIHVAAGRDLSPGIERNYESREICKHLLKGIIYIFCL